MSAHPIQIGKSVLANSIAMTAAPNGGRKTKADHSALPLSATELAECAEACLDGGASMIHIHVRDAAGAHSLDAQRYEAAIRAIRDRIGHSLIIQITTEALGRYTPQEQIALIRTLRPEAASIALRELLPDPSDTTGFASLLLWMRKERITPQIILYDRPDLETLKALMDRGVVPADDVPVLFVLGRYSNGQESRPGDLVDFLSTAEARFVHWTVCAFGRQEASCCMAAALLGGHIRIGFENNLYLPDGRKAESNDQLMKPVTMGLRSLARTLQTADMHREALAKIW